MNEKTKKNLLEPEASVEYLLEGISGNVSLVIAGESAQFSFQMTGSDYDSFTHN